MPTDRKAQYETISVNGFPCLIVRKNTTPSKRAILYFFGGGMVIGPDKGDLPVMRKLCRETGCDVWFPFYPLCMEHCIIETYEMVYECYRRMIELYGGGNVSTCGLSSGGALALGIAAHNNAHEKPLPQPRHIGEAELAGDLPDGPPRRDDVVGRLVPVVLGELLVLGPRLGSHGHTLLRGRFICRPNYQVSTVSTGLTATMTSSRLPFE